ncbi:MAG: DUF362 domain-containing protein [Candidatus Hermodarchaeota archaeon]
MSKSLVSIVKYEKPQESVRKAVELAKGFKNLASDAKVFIKPNIVYWNKKVDFPKWGTITTSRVIEDIVKLLSEKGIKDITIIEGTITEDPKDIETAKDYCEKLGYNILKERYGVKFLNAFECTYKKIDLGNGVSAFFNEDAMKADFFINVPVLKTHSQARVSLGYKNLKGLLNVASRKQFHGTDPVKNLHYKIAQLPNAVKHRLTVIDGIYTLERGPTFDGKAFRKDILVASTDILSADMVGAKLLGAEPSEVEHLKYAAKNQNRPLDFSDIEIVGEKLEDLSSFHEWDFLYEENDTLPLPFAKIGVKGLKYHKYDSTLCTYCSHLTGLLLMAIKTAWKGKPFDNVEVLVGKSLEPTEGMNKTILVGQCQYSKNKDHPNIKELIPIKGCPPAADQVQDALKQAGINVPNYFFKNLDSGPLLFLQRYKDKPEFEESFFRIK